MYSQVPAAASTDGTMIDVLTCTLESRLAILELNADEDIHLPLQGLEYWARVRFHQLNGGSSATATAPDAGDRHAAALPVSANPVNWGRR